MGPEPASDGARVRLHRYLLGGMAISIATAFFVVPEGGNAIVVAMSSIVLIFILVGFERGTPSRSKTAIAALGFFSTLATGIVFSGVVERVVPAVEISLATTILVFAVVGPLWRRRRA